jgi:hypothetical protein
LATANGHGQVANRYDTLPSFMTRPLLLGRLLVQRLAPHLSQATMGCRELNFRPAYLFATSFALLGITQLASPALALAADTEDYTVRAGDTCATVSGVFYKGDTNALHRDNPQLGAPPHTLKPGSTLHVRKRAGGPDARVVRVKNQVEVQNPSQKPAQVNDPLQHGHRISTKEGSGAGLRFRDESDLSLGESTLVVVLGESRDKAQVQASATLVTGSLRARLSELSGKKTIETPGGTATLEAQKKQAPPAKKPGAPAPAPVVSRTAAPTNAVPAGEAHIQVDDKKTSRVAIFTGEGSIVSQKKSVAIPEAFGSKADFGKLPEPPRPLPLAPSWTQKPPSLLLQANNIDAIATASFDEPISQGHAIVAYRVVVSRAADDNDIVQEFRVGQNMRTIRFVPKEAGTYHIRVSAIDDDAFEGLPSTTATLRVAPIEVIPTGRTLTIRGATFLPDSFHSASLPRAEEIQCLLQTRPREPSRATTQTIAPSSLTVQNTSNDTLACRDPNGTVATLPLPNASFAELKLKQSLTQQEVRAARHNPASDFQTTEVTITLRDDGGAAVTLPVHTAGDSCLERSRKNQAALPESELADNDLAKRAASFETATAAQSCYGKVEFLVRSRGVELEDVVAIADPGSYRLTLRHRKRVKQVAIAARVLGSPAAVHATYTIQSPGSSSAPPGSPPRFILGAFAGARVTGSPPGLAIGGELGIRVPLREQPSQGIWLGFGASVAGETYGVRESKLGQADVTASQSAVAFAVPIAMHFANTTRFTPYVGVASGVLFQEATGTLRVPDRTAADTQTGATSFATLAGFVGGEVRVGPGAFFLQAAYRGATPLERQGLTVGMKGAAIDGGFRLVLP